MKKSEFFNLDFKDLLKGALLVAVTTIITALLQVIDNGSIMTLIEWITIKPILIVGLTTFISYLLKNLLTNSNDEHFRKE